MGLKKWMSVVRSEHNGISGSSRKQDRKQAKKLKKLQNLAIAKHQPMEKVMMEVMGNKRISKKKKRIARLLDTRETQDGESDLAFFDDLPSSKLIERNMQQSTNDESEPDSDKDLTYEQYLKEVKDKRKKLAKESDNAAQDDIDIHRYSKLLGIKDGKKSKKLKTFTNDGLDYLLDFCDSDNRKRMLTSSFDPEIGGDLTDDDDDISDADAKFNFEEDANSLEEEERTKVIDEKESNKKRENESENDNEDDIREDIYGRTINRKTGEVINADPKAALKKLEDLDTNGGENESKLLLDRALMGTINRLSEGTLVKSHQLVYDFWQNCSKNDVKSCLTRIVLRLIGSPYRLQHQLLSLYALFIAHIHAFTSDEISAFFVEAFLRDFVEQISQPQNVDDKKLENSVIFMAYLLNFHVIKKSVIVEVLQKLREKLSLDNLQLVVVLASHSYKTLRRHHWSAFSEELSNISRSVESAVFSALPRAKFLVENLLALQKSAPTNVDMSITEHHLKLFQGLRKKNKLVSDQELGMSLDDILHAEERGRWWVVGSAYRVVHEAGAGSHQSHSFPDEIVKLARRAKMNTEIRRNVFCTVATSNDEESAFERLLRLSLKGQQEREIIYVLIMMMLREKSFNPFYPMLIARFCDFDKRFILTTQYALWDRIRGADSLKLRARCRLADLIHYLISHETLAITVLKVVEWGTLSVAVSSVIRRIFKQLSTCPLRKVHRIFSPLFVKNRNPLLTESLRLFLTVNFPDNELYRKVEGFFAGES